MRLIERNSILIYSKINLMRPIERNSILIYSNIDGDGSDDTDLHYHLLLDS